MDKQLQMILGVAALGTAGYLLWKQSQKPKTFANAAAMGSLGALEGGYRTSCRGRNDRLGTFEYMGKTHYWCCQPGTFTDNMPGQKCGDLGGPKSAD